MLVAAVIMTVGMLLMSVTSLWFASSRAVPSIVAILLVVFGFELGPGPLFFVLAAEAFPANILHAGLSLSNQLAWACNIAITFLFPLMTTQLGTGGTFGVFLLINIATLIAYAAALPHHVEHAVITASPSPVSVVLALAEEPEDEPIMGVTDDVEPIGTGDKQRTNSGWGKSEKAGIELAPSPPAAGSGAAGGPAAPQKSGASWLPDQRALSSSPPYQAKDQLHSDRDAQLDLHKAPLHSPPYPSSSTPQA
jgi:adenosine/AMP kinase